MAETTTPNESAPEPDALPATADDHVALTGNMTLASMAAGGLTLRSDTPLTLQMVDPAILSNSDQPQPPRRPPPDVPGGPFEPPFQPAGIAVQGGAFTVQRNNVDLSVEGAPRVTVIGRAVATNRVPIRLVAVSLLNALNAKLEALHDARSNSEDAAVYENLKRLVEAFLAAQEQADEKPVVESTLSLVAGIRNWWTKDHLSICKTAMNISLFTGGLSVCALAGALGVSDASIVTVGVLVGGKDVVGALTALAKLLPGDD
jgi:hypothetical protein